MIERRRAVPRRESASFGGSEAGATGRERWGEPIVLVRLLLFVALAAIGMAVVLWLVTRDRRYLRFIVLTFEFTLLLLLAILLWFAAERLLAPMAGHLL